MRISKFLNSPWTKTSVAATGLIATAIACGPARLPGAQLDDLSPESGELRQVVKNDRQVVLPDGRVIECGSRPVTARFKARPLTAEEKAAHTALPLAPLEKPRWGAQKNNTLDIGMSTKVIAKTPLVQDAQVLFAIDVVALPPMVSIKSAPLLSLNLSVTSKAIGKKEIRSEVLCLLDEKLCSGILSKPKNYPDNLNTGFFGLKEPENKFFAEQLAAAQPSSSAAGSAFAAELSLGLDQLVSGTKDPNALKLIYGAADPAQPLKKRTMVFAIADDTFVASAELAVTLEEDSCKTAELTATASAPAVQN